MEKVRIRHCLICPDYTAVLVMPPSEPLEIRHQFKCGLDVPESNTVKNWIYRHLLFSGELIYIWSVFLLFWCPFMTEEFLVLQCHHPVYPWPWGDAERGDGTKIYMKFIFCHFN